MALLCGIDEVGRGPLAGPVTAASVILQDDFSISGLADSKCLSAKKRDMLAAEISQKCVCYGIGWAWPEEIDRLNIHHATFLAMRRAFFALSVLPDRLLVDGKFDPGLPVPTECIIRGDTMIPSIQAASIVAKVARDLWMIRYSWIESHYEFQLHKGYPTKVHRKCIVDFGPSAIHRHSFRTCAGR